MGTKLWLCLFVVILLPVLGHAQYVYGDKATKKYYSIDCGEVSKIQQPNMQGFKSASDAEKAGFRKAEECSPSTDKPVTAGRLVLPSKPSDTILVKDLMKDAVTIEMIETDFARYGGTHQKFVGRINVSAYYYGKYSRREADMWAFNICDDTGCTEFYMPKNYHSDSMRALIMNPTRDKRLIWTCKYEPEQFVSSNLVIGELLSCDYRYLVDD